MKKLTAPLLFLSGLFLLQQSIACSDDNEDSGLPIEVDCSGYCERAALCDEGTDVAECERDCEDALGGCMADELQEVQGLLDECAEETCDEFTECTVDAGIRCYFGL